ncbi:MAG: pyridoxamine 5'-phosphate oxidase family protein [Solirubrobacteraceae bacterium]
MSRRNQIAMTAEELSAFLEDQRVVICATNGPRGWPHLMPLWYVMRDGEVWAWTYAKSQKVRNLERDARATLQVEAGDSYDQLRGVMLETEVEIDRDVERVGALGMKLTERYAGTLTPEAREAVTAQARKRVALRFIAQHTATWDHRKLAGTY